MSQQQIPVVSQQPKSPVPPSAPVPLSDDLLRLVSGGTGGTAASTNSTSGPINVW